MEIIEKAATASKPIMGIKAGVQKSLKGFVEVVREIRQMALAVSTETFAVLVGIYLSLQSTLYSIRQ
jgi:hypothetical protein